MIFLYFLCKKKNLSKVKSRFPVERHIRVLTQNVALFQSQGSPQVETQTAKKKKKKQTKFLATNIWLKALDFTENFIEKNLEAVITDHLGDCWLTPLEQAFSK